MRRQANTNQNRGATDQRANSMTKQLTSSENMETIFEEGGTCPECKKGIMEFPKVENCSCHINPPCSRCLDNRLTCDECGFEEPESEPLPPPSQSQLDAWDKEREKWEESRRRGHTFEDGGRIFNMSHDGSSGSTMVWTGQYEGDVTAEKIFEYLGDGTFGHRGPSLFNGKFTYTKITD